MKKVFVIVLSAVLLLALVACGAVASGTSASAAQEPTAAPAEPAETEAPAEGAEDGAVNEADAVPCASRAGTYTAEDSSELAITDDGIVSLSIFRLCSMEGIVDGIDGDNLSLRLTDPNGEVMQMTFDPIAMTLTATDSQWSLIANGDSFEFTEYTPNHEAV